MREAQWDNVVIYAGLGISSIIVCLYLSISCGSKLYWHVLSDLNKNLSGSQGYGKEWFTLEPARQMIGSSGT